MRQYDIQSGVGIVAKVPGYGITHALGTTVPADATAGYAPGCLFQDLNAAAGAQLWVNQGTYASSAFVAVPTGGTTGAADVGVADAGNFTAQTTVEAALAELYQNEITVQGFVPLPLNTWRLVASNDVPAIAVASGNGGTLAVDTSPKLKRVNGATDKALRIEWANSTSIELFNQFFYPPDMDVTAAFTVNLRMGKSSNTDTTVTVTVDVFEGVGDTTRGGATAALAVSTVASYSRSITPTGGHPNFAGIILTPGTHTTDTIWLYEAYILYKRKLLTS